MPILDSGARKEFESGAVRDIREGKGRCDLLPLDVVGKLLCADHQATILSQIERFKIDGDIRLLQEAIWIFAEYHIVTDDSLNGKLCTIALEVAKHFEEGAKKYGECNWQKGIPVHCYIDSAVRHYLKFCRGDVDEPHDRAFIWNLVCCIWTCQHEPNLNDYYRSPNKCGGVE